MPRFVIQRRLGEVSDEQLEATARRAKQVREEHFPDITWEHTHVVKSDGGIVAYCVYGGPTPERLKEHASAVGMPADAIWPLLTDVDPTTL